MKVSTAVAFLAILSGLPTIPHNKSSVQKNDNQPQPPQTCRSLCKDKNLTETTQTLQGFNTKGFCYKTDLSKFLKCHSYLAAHANRLILEKLGLPLPPDPLVPQMFNINGTILLGSKTKELTQDGWLPIERSNKSDTLFNKFVEKYRLQLCKAAILGVGDLELHNIFFRKTNHGNTEFIVVDYDTRTTKPTIPPYFADLSEKQKEDLISFVRSNKYSSLLNQVFKIIGYPKSEKQIYQKGIDECKDVLIKIKNIDDEKSLENTDINPCKARMEKTFGNPLSFDTETGIWRVSKGYSTTRSKAIICKCNKKNPHKN